MDTMPATRPREQSRKVMIVNGTGSMLEMFDSVLGPGHYDVVFVESSRHAYSQVKVLQPDLVILCTRIEDVDAFRVLSMLKLDDETRDVPVLTYTTELEGDNEDPMPIERTEPELFSARVAQQMN